MENNNYNNILLDDTGLYNTSNGFRQTFLQRKIYYVNQVLDNESLMNNIIKWTKKNSVKEELSAFISLLKYKYKDIPLKNNSFMDYKIYNNYIDKIFYFDLSKIGFNIYYSKTFFEALKLARIDGTINENLNVYECFKKLINHPKIVDAKKKFNPSEIMRIYIDDYEKKHNLNEEIEIENKKY